MPDTILVITTVNKMDKITAFRDYSLLRERINRQK